MKPATSTSTDGAIDQYWTVYGEYRGEGLPDDDLFNSDFVGVFYAPTSAEAGALAREYQPCLFEDSVSVEPGADKGVHLLITDSQRDALVDGAQLTS